MKRYHNLLPFINGRFHVIIYRPKYFTIYKKYKYSKGHLSWINKSKASLDMFNKIIITLQFIYHDWNIKKYIIFNWWKKNYYYKCL